MGFKEQLARLFGRSSGSVAPKPLPRQSVEHDSIDKMVYERLMRQAPSFHDAVTDAPTIPPAVRSRTPSTSRPHRRRRSRSGRRRR
jgi:hypothetical protein